MAILFFQAKAKKEGSRADVKKCVTADYVKGPLRNCASGAIFGPGERMRAKNNKARAVKGQRC